MSETIPAPRTASDTGQGLLVLAPLRIEADAVRRGLTQPASRVVRAGMRGSRVRRDKHDPFGSMIVMGTAAGLAGDLSPGDLVVATEVSDGERTVKLPGAGLLAGELRRAGLTVRTGSVKTVDHLVKSTERPKLAAEGYLAADMETLTLLSSAGDRPVAVIRAVSDGGVGPGMVTGGIAALRSLKAAAPVAETWAAACASRTVLLAGPRSFCAGVERAIEIVDRALEQRGAPVYVRKQIVHNKRVVEDLEQRGAIFVEELDEVPSGATVVFSAHGVSPAVRADAGRRELSVIDATCPLVAKVHAEARRFAREGYTVALIGHAGHEEVEGELGEAPASTVLVQDASDVDSLSVEDDAKIAYLMQTTLAVDEASSVASALKEKFPRMRAPGSDDICYATTNRQAAVRKVAAEAEVVLVAGSRNSSNSVRLVERSEREGTPAHLIDAASDISLSWLAGKSVVGLTAGASAPPSVVDEIVEALSGLGPVSVSERVTTTESVQFGLPKEVR